MDRDFRVPEHREAGGVLMSQAEGSWSILLASIFTMRLSARRSSSQRQVRLLSTSPASSGQQALAGAVRLLPSSTYVRQSETFNSAVKHPPAAGAPVGASCATTEAAAPIRSIMAAIIALAATTLRLITVDILDSHREDEEERDK